MKFLWPGHHYLGPGNPVVNGDTVDQADEIAQLHDFKYHLAQNEEEIRDADRKAISSFAHSWWNHPSWATTAGIAGLGFKYAIESGTGVLYPSMAHIKKSGASRRLEDPIENSKHFYAERQLYLASNFAHWKEQQEALGITNPVFLSFTAFKGSSDYKGVSSVYEKGGAGYNLYFNANEKPSSAVADPGNIITVLPTSPDKPIHEFGGPIHGIAGPGFGSAGSKPSGTHHSIKKAGVAPEEPASKRPKTGHSGGATPLDKDSASGPSYTVEPSVDPSGNPADSTPPQPAEPMDTNADVTAPGASAGGDSTGTGPIIFPKSSSVYSGNVQFNKSRIITSYAFAQKMIDTTNDRYITTPLTLIPVDCLPFYIDKAEYETLRGQSGRIKNVAVTVRCLGTRISFQTAATTSTFANTDHVALGMVGHGMNLKHHGANYAYTAASTAPMVPSTAVQITAATLLRKIYETNDSTELGFYSGIPRHMGFYWTELRKKTKKDDKKSLPETMGEFRLDKVVERFLINSVIGKTICSYSYQPTLGYIGKHRTPYMPANEGQMFSIVGQCERQKITITPKDTEHNWKIDNMDELAYLPSAGELPWDRQLELECAFRDGKIYCLDKVQPQLHVGMCAIPAMDPTLEATTFQTASCYWQVDVDIPGLRCLLAIGKLDLDVPGHESLYNEP